MKTWIVENPILATFSGLAIIAGLILLWRALFKSDTTVIVENPEIVPTRTFVPVRTPIVPTRNISVPSGISMGGARVSMSGNNR